MSSGLFNGVGRCSEEKVDALIDIFIKYLEMQYGSLCDYDLYNIENRKECKLIKELRQLKGEY